MDKKKSRGTRLAHPRTGPGATSRQDNALLSMYNALSLLLLWDDAQHTHMKAEDDGKIYASFPDQSTAGRCARAQQKQHGHEDKDGLGRGAAP